MDEFSFDEFSKLTTFRFERLSQFFRFELTTFEESAPPKPSEPRAWASKRRWEKFALTGVPGLLAMDEAKRKERERARSALVKAKIPTRDRVRVGKGGRGTFVSYKDLNKAVDTALRHLSERVRRQVKLGTSSPTSC